jgi:biopolymer transport protein ExbD
MGFVNGSGSKKDLNFELNLLPVFDILSVCICFLLMTVVWVEVRSLETKQAIGGQSLDETDIKPSLWLNVDESHNITLTFKSPKAKENSYVLKSTLGKIDWAKTQSFLKSNIKNKIEIAHVLPTKTTKYDEIIKLMDLLKQNGFKDIGLSPI